MSARYWICFFGSLFGLVLALFFILLIAVPDDIPIAAKIAMGAAVYGFGWQGRVFQCRMGEEMESAQ